MGRKKKNHEPIDDSFENVVDAILEVKTENKRIKKEKNMGEQLYSVVRIIDTEEYHIFKSNVREDRGEEICSLHSEPLCGIKGLKLDDCDGPEEYGCLSRDKIIKIIEKVDDKLCGNCSKKFFKTT